jgi:hypothetical protein
MYREQLAQAIENWIYEIEMPKYIVCGTDTQ